MIDFRDWPLDRASAPADYVGPVAADYPDCIEIVERLVQPERKKLENGDSTARGYASRWWQFGRPCRSLYRTIASSDRVIVVAGTSKTLAAAFSPSRIVFSHAVMVFALETKCHLAILSSSAHFVWAWKTGSTMKGDLRYTPTAIFDTFPFPAGFEPNSPEPAAASDIRDRLDSLGTRLDTDRREVMTTIDIGLTTLYNLYHDPDLSAAVVTKEAKCTEEHASWAAEKIIALRDLHRSIDGAVRDAYGWQNLDLQHGFHELEFLPENDRVRYTVSTEARKEILRRLLALNHQRHAEEVTAGLVDASGKLLKRPGTEGVPPQRAPRKRKVTAQGGESLF